MIQFKKIAPKKIIRSGKLREAIIEKHNCENCKYIQVVEWDGGKDYTCLYPLPEPLANLLENFRSNKYSNCACWEGQDI